MLIKGILTLGILIVIGGLGIPLVGPGFLGIHDEGRAAKIVEFTRGLTDVMLTAQISHPSGQPVTTQMADMTTGSLQTELGNLFSKNIEVDQGIVVPGVVTLTDVGSDGDTDSLEVLVVSSPDLSDDICRDINKTFGTVDAEGEGLLPAFAGTTATFNAALDGTALTAGQLADIVSLVEAGGLVEGDTSEFEGRCVQNGTAGEQNIFVHIVGEI